MQLRPYQLDAIESIASAQATDGQNRLLVKMPTGTGKTVMFAALLKTLGQRFEYLIKGKRKGARMLVIAHREELLDQAADKITRSNPGVMVSIEQGERYSNPYSDVIIASIQTLAARKFARLKRLMARHDFPLVLVDEAHHSAAASYRTTLAHLGFLPMGVVSEDGEVEAADFDDVKEMEVALAGWDARAPKDRLLVGVTATPNRTDAIGLGCVFQTIAYSYGLKQAIADGWLVPIEPWVVETDTSLDNVRITHGEFNQKDLADTVNNEYRNQLAVAAWKDYAEHKPTLAFTVDVAHAHDLAETFRRGGYRFEALSGQTPKDERKRILRQFQQGEIEGITNCMVLTEGTDLPLTECILHAKPTKSATLYEQMTGRGLRIHPGKERCTVIDIVDIARRHSLQAAPVLYGLPPSLVAKGKDLTQLEADLEALREKYPNFDIDGALEQGHLTLEQLAARATTFDVWTVQDLGPIGAGLSLNWIKTGDSYRLQYPWADGTETIAVSLDLLGHWDIALTMRVRESGETRQRTIGQQIATAPAALALAESFVQSERRSVTRLKDKAAGWRNAPASPAQIQTLTRMRVPYREPLTKGQASDLLDIAFARKSGAKSFRRA